MPRAAFRVIDFRVVDFRVAAFRVADFRAVDFRAVDLWLVAFRLVAFRLPAFRAGVRAVAFRVGLRVAVARAAAFAGFRAPLRLERFAAFLGLRPAFFLVAMRSSGLWVSRTPRIGSIPGPAYHHAAAMKAPP
jgi:hypothetical protein